MYNNKFQPGDRAHCVLMLTLPTTVDNVSTKADVASALDVKIDVCKANLDVDIVWYTSAISVYTAIGTAKIKNKANVKFKNIFMKIKILSKNWWI